VLDIIKKSYRPDTFLRPGPHYWPCTWPSIPKQWINRYVN